MDMIITSIQGLGGFALYFISSVVVLLAFKFIYTMITPYDEWALVKSNNSAAAIALTGTLIGYAIALGSAAKNSVNYVDFIVWAVVALITQVLAYLIVRVLMPLIASRIEKAEVSAGIVLGGVSIAIGILNAACMTY
ncbi:DUF350 domain-containing protein [Zooshikella harenae]|uniref:DUF350 domain-containing protein n=1 Tax=Zooshikella harenae TaxID=2827238 RepID=A0ABS5Z635_9GAMM|nr:DUF350 domain-containing protein [Zooshikella harenae]MBU2709465.1 DUF350 domain-containing protein [Zooshikella harenae]